jgi:amidohydrolase
VPPQPASDPELARDAEPAATLAAARELLPWLIEIRRDLHRHPELGLEEHRTAGRVQALLDELGIRHRDGIAQTGVLGTVEGGRPGRCVALRADLDALPLEDSKDVPYRSEVPGKMHACGHDVHTTILLGAARLLAARRAELAGTIKLFFQPAEETVGGARLMIEEGALEDPPVEAIFGLHVDPTLDVGQVGVRYGQRNASSDDVLITVHGRSAHGAYPATGVDAIVVAAQVVTALQSVVSRNLDARHSAVVTIGTVHGGTQGNIVANRVEMVGTVRTLDAKIRELVLGRVRELAEGVAAGFGGRAEVEIRPSYDPLVNHDPMVDVVRANAERLLGAANVLEIPRPSLGVEDFAFYVSRVPGAFYSLGVRNEAAGIVHPVHHNQFDVDEQCLAIGAALQTLNALSILRAEMPPAPAAG